LKKQGISASGAGERKRSERERAGAVRATIANGAAAASQGVGYGAHAFLYNGVAKLRRAVRLLCRAWNSRIRLVGSRIADRGIETA